MIHNLPSHIHKNAWLNQSRTIRLLGFLRISNLNDRSLKISCILKKVADEDDFREELEESFEPQLSEVELNQLGKKKPNALGVKWTPREVYDNFRERLLKRRQKGIERVQRLYPEEALPGQTLESDMVLVTPGETEYALKNNPKILNWFEKMKNFKIPEQYKLVVLVPCAASKPWGRLTAPGAGRYYRGYWDAIERLEESKRDELVYWVTISEPLGVIPQDHWNDFPIYDNPGLFKDPAMQSGLEKQKWVRLYGQKYFLPFDDDAQRESIKILGNVISNFIENNQSPGRSWLSLVGRAKPGGRKTTHTEMLDDAVKFLQQGGCDIDLTRRPKMTNTPGKALRGPISDYTYDEINKLIDK